MNTSSILHIALVIHFIALAMAVGITIVNPVAFRQFWNLYDKNKKQGLAAFRATKNFLLVGMIGLGLLIITGIIMLWCYQWTLADLLWFKIKMSCVVLLFLNGLLRGRKPNIKLLKLLSEEKSTNEVQPETMHLRKQLQIFHLTQLGIFIIAIIMAVFKFN
jgi:hypothetical protein